MTTETKRRTKRKTKAPAPPPEPEVEVKEQEEEIEEIINKLEIWTVDKRIEQVKMLLYGDGGVGKTRFASTAPNPIFLDADKGMMSVLHEVGRWPVDAWEDLQIVFEMLMMENHGFETVVLDSMNRIQELSMDYVIRTFPARRREYGSQPTQPDWGKALDDQMRMIRAFLSLPMNVIITCHPQPGLSEVDTIRPQLSGKQTANRLTRYVDLVGYMWVEVGDEDRPLRKLGFDLAWAVSKSRLQDTLPPVVEDPTWAKLAEFWTEEGQKK